MYKTAMEQGRQRRVAAGCPPGTCVRYEPGAEAEYTKAMEAAAAADREISARHAEISSEFARLGCTQSGPTFLSFTRPLVGHEPIRESVDKDDPDPQIRELFRRLLMLVRPAMVALPASHPCDCPACEARVRALIARAMFGVGAAD